MHVINTIPEFIERNFREMSESLSDEDRIAYREQSANSLTNEVLAAFSSGTWGNKPSDELPPGATFNEIYECVKRYRHILDNK